MPLGLQIYHVTKLQFWMIAVAKRLIQVPVLMQSPMRMAQTRLHQIRIPVLTQRQMRRAQPRLDLIQIRFLTQSQMRRAQPRLHRIWTKVPSQQMQQSVNQILIPIQAAPQMQSQMVMAQPRLSNLVGIVSNIDPLTTTTSADRAFVVGSAEGLNMLRSPSRDGGSPNIVI